MSDELNGRSLCALRAVAVNPQGLRLGAHPSFVPKLVEMGLVVRRRRNPRINTKAWFLPPAGPDLVATIGTGKPGEPECSRLNNLAVCPTDRRQVWQIVSY